MPEILDVLVLESHPHAAGAAAAALEAAGHRVHRCHEPGDRGFPCAGVTDPASCPIEDVDVALLVRSHLTPRPTPLENGVSCAIRAGVPLVEDGPSLLDPFEPWLAERSDGKVVDACVRSCEHAFDPLRGDIATRIAVLLDAAGVDPGATECRIETDGPRLKVHLQGPLIGRKFEHAIGVRVLDAVRSSNRTYGEVNVSYHTNPDALHQADDHEDAADPLRPRLRH